MGERLATPAAVGLGVVMAGMHARCAGRAAAGGSETTPGRRPCWRPCPGPSRGFASYVVAAGRGSVAVPAVLSSQRAAVSTLLAVVMGERLT